MSQFLNAMAAVVLANLPLRWWGPFEERFPLYRFSWLSGLVTMAVGIALGIPGYIGFIKRAAGGINDALIGAQSDLVFIPGAALLSLPVFLFSTLTGLASLYLTASGFLRAAAAYVADDIHGDFLLTGLDWIVRKTVAHEDEVRRVAEREQREGPEVPDRLVIGAHLGRPDFELILLASRAKPDWEPKGYVVTEDGTAYQIGIPFDFQTRAGLRTAYPLTELRTGEVIRYAVRYELPPLWRRPEPQA